MVIAVGATVVHVERRGRKMREILRTKIVRETKLHWEDDRGDTWRKKDGSRVRYSTTQRFIMTPEDFAKEQGAC